LLKYSILFTCVIVFNTIVSWNVFIIVRHHRKNNFAIDKSKIIFIKSR
jgi:hypothetical protein